VFTGSGQTANGEVVTLLLQRIWEEQVVVEISPKLLRV
jgi:hypothetical protein